MNLPFAAMVPILSAVPLDSLAFWPPFWLLICCMISHAEILCLVLCLFFSALDPYK
jgi:hypothetical protein